MSRSSEETRAAVLAALDLARQALDEYAAGTDEPDAALVDVADKVDEASELLLGDE